MARIVFFSDTHLGFDTLKRPPRIQRRRRGADFFANFNRVLSCAVASAADLVIHGGDMFDRSEPPPQVVDAAYARLMEFAESGIPIVIVPGNHERSALPPSLFLRHPRIHILDTPRTVVFDLAGQRIAISGFAFHRRIGRVFGALIRETRWHEAAADVRLLCVHLAFAGARVGPSDFCFRRGLGVADHAEVPNAFAAVLSGHIHRAQTLAGRVPVIYPGSIERTSFAEKDETKVFLELSVEPGRVEQRAYVLPARPMHELRVDANCTEIDVVRSIRALEPDAIVRLRTTDVNPAITSARIRRLLPPTMNVEVAFARQSAT